MSDDNKELEILIEIAKHPTEKKEKSTSLSEAHRFILHYNILQGEHKVRPSIIYERYKIWKNNKNVQSKQKFFRDFAKIMPRQEDSKTTFYMLNMSLVEVENDK